MARRVFWPLFHAGIPSRHGQRDPHPDGRRYRPHGRYRYHHSHAIVDARGHAEANRVAVRRDDVHGDGVRHPSRRRGAEHAQLTRSEVTRGVGRNIGCGELSPRRARSSVYGNAGQGLLGGADDLPAHLEAPGVAELGALRAAAVGEHRSGLAVASCQDAPDE